MANYKKQLDALIGSRPNYNIFDEAYQNRDLAKANAFGRDRAFQGMESQLEQDKADTAGLLQGYTGSTAAILSSLGGLHESTNKAKRGLAVDEAALGRQKLNDLYGANQALVDEQDKAWNFNVNEPYQLKIEELRRRQKAKQENAWRIADTIASLGVQAATMGAGAPVAG